MANQYPQLETERLLLNVPTVTDIPQIVEYVSDYQIAGNTTNIPYPFHEKDAVYRLPRTEYDALS